MVQYFLMATPPQISPGSKVRVTLDENNRTTGGAFQIWRGEELLYQGSQYGTIAPDPAPEVWRPIGLIQRNEQDYFILLYVPKDAERSEYDLRLATTVGSRSGRFQVI